MDREGIQWVIEQLDGRNVYHGPKDVQLSCPLAPWRFGHKSDCDVSPSMGIRINPDDKSKVNCFACHFHGDLVSLVEAIHQYSDRDLTRLAVQVAQMEAVDPEWLASSLGDWSKEGTEQQEETTFSEEEIAHMMGKTHPYMVQERKFDIETLKVWGTGFDRSRVRCVFPIRRRDDNALVGMVGRGVTRSVDPVYYNYFNFNKGHYLHGEHLIRNGTTLVISEGLLDGPMVWQALNKAGRLSEYSSVSLLGSMATIIQMDRIRRFSDSIVLFLDNDPSGWTGNLWLARKLCKKMRVYGVHYPQQMGGDPDELIRDGVDVVGLIEDAELIMV
jgi:DNA primase